MLNTDVDHFGGWPWGSLSISASINTDVRTEWGKLGLLARTHYSSEDLVGWAYIVESNYGPSPTEIVLGEQGVLFLPFEGAPQYITNERVIKIPSGTATIYFNVKMEQVGSGDWRTGYLTVKAGNKTIKHDM